MDYVEVSADDYNGPHSTYIAPRDQTVRVLPGEKNDIIQQVLVRVVYEGAEIEITAKASNGEK